MKAILLDHDDSFTFNLRSWLSPAFTEITVLNHRDLDKIQSLDDYLLILSPGPKSPENYPHVIKLLQTLPQTQKVFGVCLGLQSLVYASGGNVLAYTPPLHGKTSKLNVHHKKLSAFNNQSIARYHSLICTNYESKFAVLATSQDDQHPMWLQHNSLPWIGFQFHPESFLTENSEQYLKYLNDWYLS